MGTSDFDRMRADYRAAVPVLQAEGWDAEDISAINPAIVAARDAGDDALLACWCEWLHDKAAGAWISVCDGVAIVPNLSLAAESRILDAQWARRARR